MSKCSNYGTVKGCGRCVVDITKDEDLNRLSLVSVSMILSSILEILVSDINTKKRTNITIRCNGIIQVHENVECSNQPYLSVGTYSGYKYILLRWLGTQQLDSTTTSIVNQHLLNLSSTSTIYDLYIISQNLI